MAINAEWLFNKLGKKFYPVSHAKSTVRGDSTVDKDLSSMESKIESIQKYIRNVGILASEDDVRQLALDIIKNKHESDISIDDIDNYLSGITISDENVSDVSN